MKIYKFCIFLMLFLTMTITQAFAEVQTRDGLKFEVKFLNEKVVYGEPVFFNVSVTNESKEDKYVEPFAEDGPIWWSVTTSTKRGMADKGSPSKDYKIKLNPGESYTETFDVCKPYIIPFPVGAYSLTVVYEPDNGIEDIWIGNLEFTDLHFRVQAPNKQQQKAADLYWFIKEKFKNESEFDEVNKKYEELLTMQVSIFYKNNSKSFIALQNCRENKLKVAYNLLKSYLNEKNQIPFYSNFMANVYATYMLKDNNLDEAEWAFNKMSKGYIKSKGLEKCANLRAKSNIKN